MNFRRSTTRDEPEINLIPMLDVLLVIIIFLMLTTTYAKYSGIEIHLPTADSPSSTNEVKDINVAISAAGEVQINQQTLANSEPAALADALKRARQAMTTPNPVVIISADAKSMHQKTIDVLQAAQNAGLPHVTFATQKPADE